MATTQTSNPTYPLAVLLGLLAGIVTVLGVPPIFWHARNRNIAAASLVSWILINNLMSIVNVIIWHNEDVRKWYSGIGLCDIEIKIMIARSVALPAATMCILKSLAKVLDTDKMNLAPSQAQKRRAAALDLAFCLGLPVITMLLHYVVQPGRYALTAISGCVPMYFESWLTVLLLDVPPLILAPINVYLAVLVIYRLRAYRLTVSVLLESSNTTKSRFMRLFVLSLTLIMILVPLQIYVTYLNWPRVYVRYSWSQIHNSEAWQEITLIPSNGEVLQDRWVDVALGAVVVVFFGMGKEAVACYRSWLLAIGAGRIFPCLKEDTRRPNPAITSSFGSRIRLFVSSKLGSTQTSNTNSGSLTDCSLTDLRSPHEDEFPSVNSRMQEV